MIINKVELEQKEIEAIKTLSSIDCSELVSCTDCPLFIQNSKESCVRDSARNVSKKLFDEDMSKYME